jgi:hypothetical protein
MRILKYRLETVPGLNELVIEGRAEFLSVGLQNGWLTAWAEVGPWERNPLTGELGKPTDQGSYYLLVLFTGATVQRPPSRFLGTVQMDMPIDRQLVMHVFALNKVLFNGQEFTSE